jgi:hypothetical protein
MMYFLQISQWGGHDSSKYDHLKLAKHYYGTVRDEQGKVVQEVLQCDTRQRVVEIARKWAGKNKLVVRQGVKSF